MYLILSALCTPEKWLKPGDVSDLRGISKKFIDWALENGVIEQVDGAPDEPEEQVLLQDYKGCCGG